MSTCFVIQPFDGGKFDKRYEDVFQEAVRGAKLEPYRVDRDPNVSIPIEKIQQGIESATVCLADITLDNPNVWFELGYAIACRKDVVMVIITPICLPLVITAIPTIAPLAVYAAQKLNPPSKRK